MESPDALPTPEAWTAFLQHIDRAYAESDQERNLRHHSHERAETEMRALSENLAVARDAALASARAKAEFLATMSHEIRTPLNGVIGMAALLLDSTLTEEQRDHATTLNASAESLLTIISDILDFSKLEAGKLELEDIDFDMRKLVEEVGQILHLRAQEKGIELVTSLAPQVTRKLRGDPNRLRQILLNLANNAIKFTHYGEVVLRVQPLEELGDRVRLTFSVSDTGIGIPKARMDRLFRAFSQVDASTTRRYGGTGLGLAISKELVERMGGSIEAESEEGRGSTFRFQVTFQKTPQDALSDPTAEVSFNGLRVLIVDDNSTNREVFVNLLKSWGCETDTASSGSEALDRLEEAAVAGRRFELGLLDFHMPGMNGSQLATLVRSTPSICTTPMILTSSMPKLSNNHRPDLFSAQLTKPVRYNVLRDAVAQAAHQSLPAPKMVEPPKRPVADGAHRILIVEDNVVNQKVAGRLLERRGYAYDVANNGIEAIAALSRRPYDVVLMDCQMPHMDGYEATRQIRLRKDARARTVVVAMTADALAGDRERCLAAQMDDYISKPVRPAELYALLDQHLGGRTVEQRGIVE